jgi:hypothetical protein
MSYARPCFVINSFNLTCPDARMGRRKERKDKYFILILLGADKIQQKRNYLKSLSMGHHIGEAYKDAWAMVVELYLAYANFSLP